MGQLFDSQNVTKRVKDPFWNERITFSMRNRTPQDFSIRSVTLVYDINHPKTEQDIFRQTDVIDQNYPWGMQGGIITYEMFDATRTIRLQQLIVEGSGPITGGFRIYDPYVDYNVYLDKFSIVDSKFVYDFRDSYYFYTREDFAKMIAFSLVKDIENMSVGTAQILEIFKLK